MFLLIKNSKINFNNFYYKKIIESLEKNNLSFSRIENYPFTKKNLTTLQNHKIIIVMGGDGTIFNLFQNMKKPEDVLIVPINFGRLGYINSISGQEAIKIIENLVDLKESIKDKKLKIDYRHLVGIQNQNKNYLCLNEIIIKSKIQGRPIDFEVYLNGENLLKFKGDGIIVATPTGSTAYNLSASGPILAPGIEAFIFTPISSHSLTLKPIVLAKNDELKITFDKNLDNKIIFLDGQQLLDSKLEFLTCRLAQEKLSFIKPYNENHFGVLQKKLHWGKNLY